MTTNHQRTDNIRWQYRAVHMSASRGKNNEKTKKINRIEQLSKSGKTSSKSVKTVRWGPTVGDEKDL